MILRIMKDIVETSIIRNKNNAYNREYISSVGRASGNSEGHGFESHILLSIIFFLGGKNSETANFKMAKSIRCISKQAF